jgi:ABC-type glycerol-3-phosphate transport system permease component
MILCIYPLYYVLIYSLSDPVRGFGKIFLWPYGFRISAYKGIFAQNDITYSALVSLARTVLGTLLTVFGSGLFAFVVSQKELPKRRFIYRFVVVTMYFQAGLIPWYMTMKLLGLKNNFLLYILPAVVVPFFVVLMKTYYESMPPALMESAMVDGASYPRIYRSIVIPISKPIFATVAVFSAVGQWNQWMDNYLLANIPSLQTMQLTLYNYLQESARLSQLSTSSMSTSTAQAALSQVTPQTIRAAITVIVVLPVMLFYPFMQRHFTKGLILGAVKG